ncbi:DUF4270 family protein [Roseivirga pacifica]|nr:DUF4270 family protein [Roseivirga pacifica]MCO6367081.1 DUF4270 family protein [Roseivirga pacifica]MCO6370387.1 DUF4270 family protein [Roseivirga pacifica]MCO6374738.1 DUF4270 family protein [Roseivirga pacifica]MCO6379996.1 DUF4270 family protein [Roseivirga pacifica]
MNLLGKIRIFGAFLVVGLIVFNSCEDSGPFGLGTEDVAPLEFFTEDIPIPVSQVLIDSINSRGTGRLLTGAVNSPAGQMSATAYSALTFEADVTDRPDAAATLDSVKFSINFNYLYDESEVNSFASIKAYKIQKSFPDTTYVTSSTLPLTNELIASADLNIVDLDSTYELVLDQAWADYVFSGFLNEEDEFENDSTFNRFMPGLGFVVEGNQSNIFSIVSGQDLEIRFYYSQPAADGSGLTDNKEFAITGENKPNFFNLTVDRSATDYSAIQQPATEYASPAYSLVHSGGAVITKLDISGLNDFSESKDNAVINLVEFTVGPILDLPEDVDPPAALYMYFTDDQNIPVRDGSNFRGIQRDGTNVLSSAFPVTLAYDEETKTYSNSITTFVQSYYQDVFRRNHVFLFPTDINQSVNSFQINPDDINLKIFFSELSR